MTNKKTLTLKEMRLSRNMSITNAAQQVRAAYPSLVNWEQHKTIPNIVVISKLLKLYDYQLSDLNISVYDHYESQKKYKQ